MRNVIVTKRSKAYPPMYHEVSRQRWYGWDDYRLGLGYRKEYETWTVAQQQNYESGRRYAAICKGEWGTVPEWNPYLTMFKALLMNNVMHDVLDAIVEEHEMFKEIDTKAVH